jgi:hypothetical protein
MCKNSSDSTECIKRESIKSSCIRIFEMEQEHYFAAVPHTENHMTVTEIVTEAKILVRQQTKIKKESIDCQA